MKKLIIIFTAIFLVCGCANKKETIEEVPEYKEIMEANNYIIVDVRTKEEYDTGHIKNAINIPYDSIGSLVVSEEDFDESMEDGTYILEGDTETVVFVYCASGVRSSYAYTVLTNMGINAYNLGAYGSIDLPKE